MYNIGISEAQVRFQLAMRDASTNASFEITPSMLISQGLELEDQQYVNNMTHP